MFYLKSISLPPEHSHFLLSSSPSASPSHQASIGAAGRPLTLTLSRPTVATLAKIAKAHKRAAVAAAAAENPDGSNLTGGPYGEGISVVERSVHIRERMLRWT